MARDGWRDGIANCDFRGVTILHLAARVHDPGAQPADYEADNVVKTRVLAEAAAAAGAARFVFASTVKVLGEESGARAFTELDSANPADAYARSKWQAEEALREVAGRTGLPVVILRIPLTYGPGAAGNFRALVRLADTAWWLPFGGIANRRSLVHLDDLVEAIILAASHPDAPGRTFLVAHPEPVSTARLVESIRSALARPGRLFAVAPALLETGASMIGQSARMRRLTRSLEVDPSALVRDLGWEPRVTLDAGIAASVRSMRA
jgi:nucleoside-diphosphate-sugar epimerase